MKKILRIIFFLVVIGLLIYFWPKINWQKVKDYVDFSKPWQLVVQIWQELEKSFGFDLSGEKIKHFIIETLGINYPKIFSDFFGWLAGIFEGLSNFFRR